MPRQNPLEAFRAQGLPPNPVGTPDELAAHKMPTRIFKSCSEPSPDETNAGCPFWYECDMSYKGLPVAEGGGPRNHCWERIKSPENGGGIVRNVQACFWGVAQQDVAAENGEVLQPIADEGEPWEELTTHPDTKGPRDQFGFQKWVTDIVKHDAVQPFTRLGQEQKLAQHELRASIIQREQKRRKDAREAKKFGAEGSGEPLDKRGRRGTQGKKEES